MSIAGIFTGAEELVGKLGQPERSVADVHAEQHRAALAGGRTHLFRPPHHLRMRARDHPLLIRTGAVREHWRRRVAKRVLANPEAHADELVEARDLSAPRRPRTQAHDRLGEGVDPREEELRAQPARRDGAALKRH